MSLAEVMLGHTIKGLPTSEDTLGIHKWMQEFQEAQ